jgi:hypothetical protein
MNEWADVVAVLCVLRGSTKFKSSYGRAFSLVNDEPLDALIECPRWFNKADQLEVEPQRSQRSRRNGSEK